MSKQKQTKITRSQARSLAFQVLYSLEFTQISSITELREAFVCAPRVKITYQDSSIQETTLDELDLEPTEENENPMLFLPGVDELLANEGDTIEDTNENVLPSGFSWELVEGVWKHLADLDKTIEEFAKNWKINRLGRIELTILRMSLYEMLYRDDIPIKVSIAEALELTNQFGESKARSFINGLLDAVHKSKLQQKA